MDVMLQSHRANYCSSIDEIPCQQCNRLFRRASALRSHMVSGHGATNEDEVMAEQDEYCDAVVKSPLEIDPLLRAVAHALVTVGNRPSSIMQLAMLIDKMQLLDDSCIFTPFAMLSKLNVHLKERAAVKEEPLFKWVAVNKTLNHYYLNSPSIPAIPWIHPTPQIARASPEKGTSKPASRASAAAASASASHMAPASGITNSVEAAAYANLSKAERKRLLFGEPHSDSGSHLPRTKKAKTLHKRSSGGGGGSLAAAAVGGFDYDTDTDDESMEYARIPQDSATGGRMNSSSSGKKRAGPQESKCNLKALPPYTDLLASDPMPFVPSVLNPDVNSLVVPPNTYYHIQDDRCMNRKRYSEFPKCRSCIWKHRERLPHCFYVGFRAFLVRVPETKPLPANPVVDAESEDGETGADGADHAKSIKTDADDAGKLVSIDDKQESASTASASESAGTIHSAVQSTKKPFRAKDLDPADPFRVIADLPPGDLIYGPYFIAGGLSNAAHAVNGAGQKKTAVGGGAGGSHAKKRAKMSELQSSSDEAETAKMYQPSKSNGGGNVLRRHKSMPAFGSSAAGLLSGTEELATPASRKTAHYKSIKLASAASLASGVSLSMSPLGGASSESPTAPSLALEDHNSDFTDLVVTPNLPFVPSLADPTVNKILIPPKTLFHIQDDKCLNKKRYNDFPKCRSCRWKHKERLPHCFYVGFRAFLLTSVPEDAPALPLAAATTTEGGNHQNGPFNREEILQYRYQGDVVSEDLLYGPYFMPGGVDVEGHVLATVGVKKGVAGRKKRGRPASAALPSNNRDSMDGGGGDGDDARRESFISAADTFDEGDSFAAATEDEVAVDDVSPSTGDAATTAGLGSVSVAEPVELSETIADTVAVESVQDSAHVPSVEPSLAVEKIANENANETSHVDQAAAPVSEVAGAIEDLVKDVDGHSQVDSMDVDMNEPIKESTVEEQKPAETAMVLDTENTAPVVPPHAAVIDESAAAVDDVEMSAVDASVKDATVELKEVETDHTVATADSAVTQPPAAEWKEAAEIATSEDASREIPPRETASEHANLQITTEIQPPKENVHDVAEKTTISHLPVESCHTPATAPVVIANVQHLVVSQPENEVHSNIRESSLQPHMHQNSSHLMSSFSSSGEGVRERSCELAALADIVLAVGERMPEFPASVTESAHSGNLNQHASSESFSLLRNENNSPHTDAGATGAGTNGTPNLLDGLQLLSTTASQDESSSAVAFMDKSRAKEYAAKIRGALLEDGVSRFMESGKLASAKRHGEQ
ncbi:hypothetical protein HDU78_009778 [Chytriomyces hyalinus]|nr:hypothetical protein HDU78_009778 [Chytriomyces hyalinus]